MEIKRFDDTELVVLSAAMKMHYCTGDIYVERALVLMEEGILVDSPLTEWYLSGLNLTPMGVEYYAAFMQKMRQTHGHVWLTNTELGFFKDTKYGDEISMFAYAEGYHNGPKCKNCGYTFCEHCTSEMEISHCFYKGGVKNG